ncbi:Uncharacterised protein [Candidatus Bilamarchaeum dharawalense]|uniref:Uncharacterized protein n=1 Tax=Candidatus Bilamarchaeum dharawalense TaxID=2885759 RepID=A0A5E4LST7_9ARCH|nr:Uncharacterised protein [Candidatus Bilamarchaeum dharawalense]
MRFDNPSVAAIIVLAVLVALAVFLYKPVFENPETVFKEDPLEKNKEVQFQPGQQYVYGYMFNGTQINMTYVILPDPYCTRIRMLESQNISESCIDKWGMDEKGYNSTLENPHMILFKPWMLALKEGWRWSNAMYLSYNGNTYPISASEYRVVRIDQYMNRSAFIVEIKTQSGSVEYEWVDVEKRILLKTSGPGYEVFLAEQS